MGCGQEERIRGDHPRLPNLPVQYGRSFRGKECRYRLKPAKRRLPGPPDCSNGNVPPSRGRPIPPAANNPALKFRRRVFGNCRPAFVCLASAKSSIAPGARQFRLRIDTWGKSTGFSRSSAAIINERLEAEEGSEIMPYWLDGNNLIGQSAARARLDRETRAQFLNSVAQYARNKSSIFTVYFDGDDPDRRIPPRGVNVRYCAPISTDDAIIRRLHESRNPSEIIVVTNDGSLRTACRSAGAKSMNWSEFQDRMQRAARHTPGSDKGEAPIDVEEWSRYFGLGEDPPD
jgi:predicted RNA-binding protein with PIN domain